MLNNFETHDQIVQELLMLSRTTLFHGVAVISRISCSLYADDDNAIIKSGSYDKRQAMLVHISWFYKIEAILPIYIHLVIFCCVLLLF